MLQKWLLGVALLGISCALQTAPKPSPQEPSMIHISAGVFTMGSDQAEADEAPAHRVDLTDFWISPRPVTRAEFARFLRASGYQGQVFGKKSEDFDMVAPGREEQPVTGVSWKGANAYCSWAGVRLPSEAEWEKSARGTEGLLYPWGNAWDPAGLMQPSPFGCMGMAGQIWEWCSSKYATYPYLSQDGREDAQDEDAARVVRGGSGADHPSLWRCSNRFRISPNQDMPFLAHTGFRVARSGESSPTPVALTPPIQRRPAPYFQILSHRVDPLPTLQQDRQHRVSPGALPGQLLGYPLTRSLNLAYFIPLEHLADLAARSRRERFVGMEKLLKLRKGLVMADIGTGSGVLLDSFSRAVGLQGRVWATDVSASALQSLQAWMNPRPGVAPAQDPYYFQRTFPRPLPNVYLVLHDLTDCLLPSNSLDLAYLGQVHYFYYPRARPGVSAPLPQVLRFYASLARSLKPDGIMVILDWSENNPVVDPQHGSLRIDEVVDQMSRAGLVLLQYKELRMTPSGCQEVPRSQEGARDSKCHAFFVFQKGKGETFPGPRSPRSETGPRGQSSGPALR